MKGSLPALGVSTKMLEAFFIDLKKKDPTLKERDFLMAMYTLKLYLTSITWLDVGDSMSKHTGQNGKKLLQPLRHYILERSSFTHLIFLRINSFYSQ